MSDIVIRPWSDSDSIAELTDLLHQAYAIWNDRDIGFVATTQTEEKTRERLAGTLTFVAVAGDRLVGTISLHDHPEWHDLPYYSQPGVWFFGQFGVLPEFKSTGVGARLLERAHQAALEGGALELACDTAEPAVELHEYYRRKGFVQVGIHEWKFANYRSLIFTKVLT